jgi:long-chain fatty acid transport protein
MYVRILVAAALLAMCFAQSVHASGFAVYEWSARGNARAGALTAQADDASAIAYNPAGITQLEGTHAMFGGTLIQPIANVRSDEFGDGRTKENFFLPPHGYLTRQLNEDWWLGLGVLTRFGLGTEYDDSWFGRYNTYKSFLTTISTTPVAAYRINDEWSVAAGLEAMYLDVDLRRRIDAQSMNDPSTSLADVDSELTGSAWGFGGLFGLRYQPREDVSFGFHYKSRVTVEVDGEADFDKPALPGLEPLFNDTGASGEITLPDQFLFGVAYSPIEDLTVELDISMTLWETYDELSFSFDEPIAPGVDESTSEKNWESTWRYALGAEYRLLDWLALRAGYVFDNNPIPDETADYLVPASDYHIATVGAGVGWRDFTADFSYMYLWSPDREVTARPADGIFDSEFTEGRTHLFGLTLGYRF